VILGAGVTVRRSWLLLAQRKHRWDHFACLILTTRCWGLCA